MLHEQITELLQANGFIASEWLLPSQNNGSAVKPPYVVVNDVDGYGIYADGKLVIPIEKVGVHFVYRSDKDSEEETRLDELLKPFGYSWTKEKFSAERVMIKTYTLEG